MPPVREHKSVSSQNPSSGDDIDHSSSKSDKSSMLSADRDRNKRSKRTPSINARASRVGVTNFINVIKSLHPGEPIIYFPITRETLQEYIDSKRKAPINAGCLEQYLQHIQAYNIAWGFGWDGHTFGPIIKKALDELRAHEIPKSSNILVLSTSQPQPTLVNSVISQLFHPTLQSPMTISPIPLHRHQIATTPQSAQIPLTMDLQPQSPQPQSQTCTPPNRRIAHILIEQKRREQQSQQPQLNPYLCPLDSNFIPSTLSTLSHDVRTDTPTSLKDWVDIKKEDEDINYFEYSNFNNIEEIDKGAFGSVYKADWKDGGIKVALKRPLNNLTIDESQKENFLKELKLLRHNIHPNINQFLGVTKDPVCDEYIMVLRYANQGNLRKYLEKYFRSLQWKNKVRMALNIACGLKYLHSKQIIHRDMHAKNILVDDDCLIIADFGLSKHISETKSNSAVLGMPAYIEPQCFINSNYKRNEKSDVYSFAVLLWEISSGRPPFYGSSEYKIIADISKGKRETPIRDTPFEYQQLYVNSWNEEPDQRHNIDEAHRILVQLLKQFNQ